MIPFIYIDPRNNPHYEYATVISDINYNFGLLSGTSTGTSVTGAFLNLSGGTVSGTTTFSGNGVSLMLIIRNPDMSQDYLQLYDNAGDKQIWIDNTNQWAFSAGTNGPLYFGTFSNPIAGLGGFSSPGEVISAFSVDTTRMGVGGGGSYFAATGPQALLELRGKADERQLILQANGTQNFNIFEGRSAAESPILVIDKNWSLRGPSMSATSLSAATYYSGSTPLELIITSLISSTDTYVQNGLNTYTGGTPFAPTVNVSALTINTLTASGNTNLQSVTATTIFASGLSATTFSAGTINSGSTNLYSIFQVNGANSVLGNGLNTYTGGTFFNQTINVSGGTFDNVRVTGTTVLSSTTATTITSPIIYGSNAFSGTLLIDSTTDNTKGPITFGTAGKTNVYNFNVGSATTVFTLRERIGATSQGALYLGVAAGSETNTNYTLSYDGTLRFNAQSSTAVIAVLHGNTASLVITPTSSVANPFYDFQARARGTLITTSNVPVFNINGSTQTWAAGTVPSQYFSFFRAHTMAFASSSTAGLVASLAVAHTTVGTNAIFGTGVGIYVSGGTYASTTNAYGVLIDTVTGATNNYGLGVIGDVGITGNTVQTGGFSAFTNSVSGVSVFHTSGGTPVFSVNTTLGRVGISMASPGHTLDVGGNINARNSIGQTGGYAINTNTIIQQGPTGYGSAMFVWGGGASNGYNIFNGVPFGIAVSGSSLTLRNALTVGQQLNGYGNIQTLTGATIITGINTNFLTTYNVGDVIRFGSNNYTISAITTDTSLTITTTASTTSANSTYFVPGGGERFYIGGNGNVRSHSASISGFTVLHQSGGTPVFNVDTKNLVNSATTLSLTGRLYNVLIPAEITSATTINWAVNNMFDYKLTANTTFTFSNVLPGQTVIVSVRQPSTGATGFNYAFTGSTVNWSNGTTPTITTTTGKTDIYTFIALSAATVYGSALTNF